MYESHQIEAYLREVQCCGRCSRPLNQHPFLFNNTNDPSFITCERFADDDPNLLWVDESELTEDSIQSTDFLPDLDYIALVDFQGLPRQTLVCDQPDYSYNPGDLFTENVAHELEFIDLHAYYQAETAALDALDRWSDNEPEFCTIATERWRDSNYKFPYDSPKTSVTVGELTLKFPSTSVPLATERVAEASVPGQVHGFTSRVLHNFIVTERYQNKFLNIFKGRDGNLHIGMLTMEYDQYGLPMATCKHGDCRGRVLSFRSLFGTTTTRRTMEDYIIHVIRHGNNHGPDWYTGRSDFAYIHAVNCDTTEHTVQYRRAIIEAPKGAFNAYGKDYEAMLPIVTPCNGHKPTIFALMLDPENVIQSYKFLKQHQRFCSTPTCKCDHYESLLWDQLHGSVLEGVLSHA